LKNTIDNCGIVSLPKIHNRAGNITSVEKQIHAPFEVKRVYYLYDVPGGAERGGHAHKQLQQFIVSVSGAFDVLLDDGANKKVIHLDRPNVGLHIASGIWRELQNFSSGAICLVLASHSYDENDYIREYTDFISMKNA